MKKLIPNFITFYNSYKDLKDKTNPIRIINVKLELRKQKIEKLKNNIK